MIKGRILTLHPDNKKGVNILKDKYEIIRSFIISEITSKGVISYKELNDVAVKQLTGKFDGKIPWYIVTVKLDLEARGIIDRAPNTSPHKLRLSKK